jgi:thioredoxin:protein disulfide reductase
MGFEQSLAESMQQLAEGGSFGLVFGIALLGGLLTALTPCVYPLIPITVRYFGGMNADKSRMRLLAVIYVVGMVALYASLGTAFAATNTVFGTFLSSPWVVGGLAVFCAAMGASMLGAFTLQLPAGLSTKLSQAGGQSAGGAFVMGLVSGLIAAPCTGPVLGVILAFIATTGEVGLGFGLMTSFGVGLGLPFLGIALFATNMKKLPSSGPWMEIVKAVLAIPMFVVAIYFLRFAWGDLRAALEAVPWSFYAGAGLLAAGLVALVVYLRSTAGTIASGLKIAGIFAVTAALTLLFFGRSEVAAGNEITWVTSHDAGIARARTEQRPVMIDFTADWCQACQELERETYIAPEVREQAKRFVNLKIDATELDDEMNKLFEKYAVRGLPTVVFLDSSGKLLDEPRVTGFVPPERFSLLMDRVR